MVVLEPFVRITDMLEISCPLVKTQHFEIVSETRVLD